MAGLGQRTVADGTAAWNQAWGGCRLTPLVRTESRRSCCACRVDQGEGVRAVYAQVLLVARAPPVPVWCELSVPKPVQTLMKLSVRFEQRSGLSQPSRDKTPSLLLRWVAPAPPPAPSTNERAARWVDPSSAPRTSQSRRWRL
ncbi:hypothetical protein SNOG_07761 [Parastagonospora nodorum SN15]|uniref:Uncharacterized protein n=1 Tax=Phaeosphaeria nodorum (strain SN15 / ATCC MYA-4574 / FGSC 10173) TaxID=321614 RepID=Q0UKF3_PHANO|nr:hypothetical protein SNOG_07761 [Parastagonospora nodorum SN15]EAT85227.1 hypothetical protein SNOG_07761 [Parastagonospora nodorum SN15]